MKGSVAGACFGFFRRALKFCKGESVQRRERSEPGLADN